MGNNLTPRCVVTGEMYYDCGLCSPYIRAVHDLRKGRLDSLIDLCKEEIERKSVGGSVSYAIEARLLRASLQLLRGECDHAMKDFDHVLNMKGVPTKVSVHLLRP